MAPGVSSSEESGVSGFASSSQTIGTGWRTRAWLKTSSMRETGTISSAFLTGSGISTRSLAFSSGIKIFFRPPRSAASNFSLSPPIGRILPRKVISPVIAMSRRIGMPVMIETIAVAMATPRLWTIRGRRAFRNVDVDVATLEHRRLDAEIDRARAGIGRRRRDRLLHDVAQISGDRHAPLAGHHHAFDRQQFAPDLGPSEAGHDADLILGFRLAVAEFGNAEKIRQVVVGDRDLLRLAGQNLFDRLAFEFGEFAVKISHTSLASIAPYDGNETAVVD